ncbi:hypothetical protein GCM10010911_49940 [Paenibacillus nasutitermitis]|uniref:Uncharacterized protein n=1 Tax=Paenibacillus nasutitermitis TaxID=1652958 RepID=A0A916ZB73_9BACL|nr:hypothetical protein GCM10010911_49940 [Paenibacillus nasutitermitis]
MIEKRLSAKKESPGTGEVSSRRTTGLCFLKKFVSASKERA